MVRSLLEVRVRYCVVRVRRVELRERHEGVWEVGRRDWRVPRCRRYRIVAVVWYCDFLKEHAQCCLELPLRGLQYLFGLVAGTAGSHDELVDHNLLPKAVHFAHFIPHLPMNIVRDS